MKRGAILLLAVLVLALVPTLGTAQGIATTGFSGIPLFNGLSSFGGIFGGPSSATCGEQLFPKSITEFYIGYMDHRRGTTIDLGNSSTPLPGFWDNLSDVTHHAPIRGVWLGLSETINLNERIGLLGSAWVLLPSNQDDTETYSFPAAVGERSWSTRNKWWYVDGLVAFNPFAGASLLAGVRYDKYTTEFRDPYAASVLSLPSDTADVITENWIPLVGAQVGYNCSQSRLIFRIVGFPTLLGSVKYRQNVSAGIGALEANGNYKNGYYLELFTQYVRRFGPGEIGAFARWSGTRGEVDLDLDASTMPPALPPPFVNATFNTTIQRYAWTVGGSVSLRFDLPFVNRPFM